MILGKRHLQPAWRQQDKVSSIYFNNSKKRTGFAGDNGFAYFCRNKSRASCRLMTKLDENSIKLRQDNFFQSVRSTITANSTYH